MKTTTEFYITNKEARVTDIVEELYPAEQAILREEFYRINAHLKPSQYLKPGYLFYVPQQTCLPASIISELQNATAEIDYQHRQMTPQQQSSFHNFKNLLAYIDSETIRTVASDLGEGLLAKTKAHKVFVANMLKRIETLYQTTLINHGHLPPSFYHQRRELLHQLAFSLNQWMRNILIPDANPHAPLKRQLNLSTKSILHRWYKNGQNFSIKEFAARYLRLQQLGGHLGSRGRLLTGIDIGFGTYNIFNACNEGINRTCLRTGVVEAAKIFGSEVGAQAGYAYGERACAASFFIPMPGSTTINCTLVVGASTIVGSELFSRISESLAGILFDYSYSHYIDDKNP